MIAKCVRCGKQLHSEHIMLQVIEYLGRTGPRVPICDACHREYVKFMTQEQETANKDMIGKTYLYFEE